MEESGVHGENHKKLICGVAQSLIYWTKWFKYYSSPYLHVSSKNKMHLIFQRLTSCGTAVILYN